MGMIPQEVIDSILDRLDIVEIISGYIQIKKSGRNFKACCPFHNEKTPSFVVSPDKQIYHCFGCAAGGNVISFVMKYENMEFPEAVKLLAAGAGVSLPETGRNSSRSSTGHLYEINQTAADFYHDILMSEEGRGALEYLKARGLDDKTLKTFMVGYAPQGWENFKTFCVKKKIPLEFARKAGLTIPSEKGKGDYDRFRNRIIFPIFSERGRVLGFGGRVLDNSLPKYINSPETPIYSKSNVLYGLNFSRQAIRDEKYVIITEGYLDVISSFKHGSTNVVATSGTALTASQVVILKKYADTAVMVFDADQAGEAASLRGLDILLQNGMKVKIATLPEGEDPDSFVRKNGRKKFEKIIDDAKGLFDYKLDLLIKKRVQERSAVSRRKYSRRYPKSTTRLFSPITSESLRNVSEWMRPRCVARWARLRRVIRIVMLRRRNKARPCTGKKASNFIY
ncbi:MAG: DNA primase [Candidatus Omnitrophota bacterium]